MVDTADRSTSDVGMTNQRFPQRSSAFWPLLAPLQEGLQAMIIERKTLPTSCFLGHSIDFSVSRYDVGRGKGRSLCFRVGFKTVQCRPQRQD